MPGKKSAKDKSYSEKSKSEKPKSVSAPQTTLTGQAGKAESAILKRHRALRDI